MMQYPASFLKLDRLLADHVVGFGVLSVRSDDGDSNMRRFLVPVVTLMALCSSPSWAWSHVTGTITSIDRNTREVVLDSGRTYTPQTNVSLTDLAAGDKVTVSTEIQNGRHVVNEVTKDD